MSVDKAQDRFELVVIEGSKAGARALLPVQGVLTVGTGFDCDIVLGEADASLPQHRIEINVNEGQFKFQILEGSLTINGMSSDTPEAFYIQPDTPVTLGGSVFTLRPADQVSGIAAVTPFAAAADEAGGDAGSSLQEDGQGADVAAAAHASQPAGRQSSRFRSLALSAFVGLCLVVAGVSSYLVRDSGQQVVVEERQSLDALLASAEYPHVAAELLPNRRGYRVSGRVATRSDHIALKSLLDGAGYPVELDVSVDEVFVEDVAAVYRLNGVEAFVEPNGPGEVVVLTGIADTDFLEQVESRAYQDVPGLVMLHRRNTPPAVITENNNADFTQLPGKKIKMVVTTEPAFILTEDGSRYFTGAVLPSGYKIKSIFEKTVQLERDNKVVDLIF